MEKVNIPEWVLKKEGKKERKRQLKRYFINNNKQNIEKKNIFFNFSICNY